MKIYRLVVITALLTLVSGCETSGKIKNLFKKQEVEVNANDNVSAYKNLDRHTAIALFQSQEGKACFQNMKTAIEISLTTKAEYRRDFVGPKQATTYNDAIIAQAKAMADLAKDSMKYASHMIAYSNGLIPQDPIVQLAALCKSNNYYDMKMAQSDNRHATAQKISGDIQQSVVGVTPFAALAFVGSKVGDRNNIRGNNNAYGDDNDVAQPTVIADGENVSTAPLPEDPNVIPEDPNTIPLDPNVIPEDPNTIPLDPNL